ncbi:hypothetical protein ACFWIJ_43045 [Streptomyces sp. NPDC127079]|uniref:hypothetical protein n=1 Tax=Streptomyces sp. NPDC127079 TaxID=3347132 RepID=UPI003663BA6B
MRRTVRALSVAVLTGAAFGVAGTAAAAGPAAGARPVGCESYTEAGTAGAVADGTRAADGTCPAGAGGDRQRPWTPPAPPAPADLGVTPDQGGTDSHGSGATVPHGDDATVPQGGGGLLPGGDDITGPRGDGGRAPGGGDGTAAHGDGGAVEPTAGDGAAEFRGGDGTAGRGDEGTAGRGGDGTAPWEAGDRPCSGGTQQSCGGGGDGRECDGVRGDAAACAPAGVQHGVAAGDGGSYTGSVPALAAGALLIAAACCGAGYRLWGGRQHRLFGGRSGADG